MLTLVGLLQLLKVHQVRVDRLAVRRKEAVKYVKAARERLGRLERRQLGRRRPDRRAWRIGRAHRSVRRRRRGRRGRPRKRRRHQLTALLQERAQVALARRIALVQLRTQPVGRLPAHTLASKQLARARGLAMRDLVNDRLLGLCGSHERRAGRRHIARDLLERDAHHRRALDGCVVVRRVHGAHHLRDGQRVVRRAAAQVERRRRTQRQVAVARGRQRQRRVAVARRRLVRSSERRVRTRLSLFLDRVQEARVLGDRRVVQVVGIDRLFRSVAPRKLLVGQVGHVLLWQRRQLVVFTGYIFRHGRQRRLADVVYIRVEVVHLRHINRRVQHMRAAAGRRQRAWLALRRDNHARPQRRHRHRRRRRHCLWLPYLRPVHRRRWRGAAQYGHRRHVRQGVGRAERRAVRGTLCRGRLLNRTRKALEQVPGVEAE